MKKTILFFLTLFCFSAAAQTPDSIKVIADSLQAKIDILETKKEAIIKADTLKHWKKGGTIGVDFSQASYTNWAAGGINSLSGLGVFNVFANYKSGKTNWDNNLDLAYGLVRLGPEAIRKSDDKIEFTSKYGREAVGDWYYSALLNFKSQFDAGYNYPDDSTVISHFMAPGYVLGALGIDYKSTDKSFSLLISPLTCKTTIVNDQRLADAGAFGMTGAEYDSAGVKIKNGEMVRYEFGGYLKMQFKKDIFKNVNFETKLELFTNYLDRPENIDVNWENILTMKINKFLSCNVNTQLIYDHDIPVPVERKINGINVPGTGPRLQFKEVLSVGLSYKF